MIVNKNECNPFQARVPILYRRYKMGILTRNGLIVTTQQKNNHTNVSEDIMRNRLLIVFGLITFWGHYCFTNKCINDMPQAIE